jgi:hypothetical protein
VPVSTYWATVEVEWLDGRTENYQVGGYARRHEAIRTTDGVLSLWMGNNAYLGPEHVISIPLGGLRRWHVKERP